MKQETSETFSFNINRLYASSLERSGSSMFSRHELGRSRSIHPLHLHYVALGLPSVSREKIYCGMTGAENVRFVARIYGVEPAELVRYVREFSEIGPHLNLPVRTYSAGMRSRLAFGVSLGIRFDTYLVDEVTSVGDARFKAKSEALLTHRLRTSGAIIVSHALPLLERICEAGMVLHDGNLTWHDHVKDAIDHHRDVIVA